MKTNALALTGVLVLLGGCMPAADTSDLQRFVAQVQARPGGQIEAVPSFENYEPFVYRAASLRSPFVAPVQQRALNRPVSDPNIKPDPDRAREYLENFSLDSLLMVGTLALGDQGSFALIADNEGQVSRVASGNFLGRNYGRITRISEAYIELTEIVPDGGDGWIERPRTLNLKAPAL
ncbi:pilus assembly protein PilP [Litorivicinus lipolyticus]|uniref:Pilus assembly protein PilP n=1 Tax=Litorivicinus lipolyticus TaxID=418701 RepID=A0A5Q2QBD4_9GAMM|nr:pilus assembly protein PilP [Litorivicinus lipolyticus]QGG79326.1 pilus assembly protein PilP [Litorivicinus lipolyticus]